MITGNPRYVDKGIETVGKQIEKPFIRRATIYNTISDIFRKVLDPHSLIEILFDPYLKHTGIVAITNSQIRKTDILQAYRHI